MFAILVIRYKQKLEQVSLFSSKSYVSHAQIGERCLAGTGIQAVIIQK